MSATEFTVEGILKPDGTLELDHKPDLLPGRVTVVLRQEPSSVPAVKEGWWQFMQRSRKELEASGSKFMDEREVSVHVESLREGDRIDDLLRETNSKRQEPEQH